MRRGNKLYKEVLSLIMSAFLLIGMIMPANMAFAESGIKDIQGHWAEKQITEWLSSGMTKGYQDNTFKPDNNITRAEFIALVNRSFNISGLAQINFKDVASDKWYYADIAKAVSNGYISGYQDNTIKPENPITRQEVAAILSRLLKSEGDSAVSVDKFKDAKDIPSWSRQPIGAVVAAGYMNGYPDGTFQPVKPITRAEAIVALDNVLKIAKSNVQYTKPGTYGPSTGKEVIQGNATITSPDVTLQNVEIKGDMLLAESIGEGNVYLKNVKVDGETIVKGGGENSIVLDGCNIAKLTINKANGKIRIVAQGTTKVENVALLSGAKLEETDTTGEGFGNVVIEAEVPESSVITLAGNFDQVDISGKGVAVEVASGKINTMNIDKSAEGAVLNIAESVTVSEVEVNANAEVKGKGTIQTAKINADGVKMEQKPQSVEVSKDVTAEVGGKEVSGEPAQSGGSGGGSSGGSGGNNSNPTNGISVNAQVGGITDHGATITLTSNGDCKVYYLVVDSNQAEVLNVTPAYVVNFNYAVHGFSSWDGNYDLSANGSKQISLDYLNYATKYTVYFTTKTQDGEIGELKVLKFTTDIDKTAPEFIGGSDESGIFILNGKASVAISSSEPARCAYVVLKKDEAEKLELTADDILDFGYINDEEKFNGISYKYYGEEYLSGNELRFATIMGLDNGKDYIAYFVLEDNAGHVSEIKTLDFTAEDMHTDDSTSPIFVDGYPKISLSVHTAEIAFEANEDVKMYFLIKKGSFSGNMSPEDIIAYNSGDDDTIINDNWMLDGNSESGMNIDWLDANTTYTLYSVLVDKSLNVSNVYKKEFRTTQETDTASPAFSDGYPIAETFNDGPTSLVVSSNKDSKVFYQVLESVYAEDNKISENDVINLENDFDWYQYEGDAQQRGIERVFADDIALINLDDLKSETEYTASLVLKDYAGRTSDVKTFTFTTPEDKTFPDFIEGYPKVKATNDGATLSVMSNENCKAYYLLILSSEKPNEALTADDIVNFDPHKDERFTKTQSGSSSAWKNREQRHGYDHLMPGTNYTLYVVLQDSAGNNSELETFDFKTTGDKILPAFMDGYPMVNYTGDTAEITFKSNVESQLYYLVIEAVYDEAYYDDIITEDFVVNYEKGDLDGLTQDISSGDMHLFVNDDGNGQGSKEFNLDPNTNYIGYFVLEGLDKDIGNLEKVNIKLPDDK